MVLQHLSFSLNNNTNKFSKFYFAVKPASISRLYLFLLITTNIRMENSFADKVANSTAHRASREEMCSMVLNNKKLLTELFSIALNTQNKYHYKACWILELVIETDFSALLPQLTLFCDTLHEYRHDGAIRSVSKICFIISYKWSKDNSMLTENQLQQITEACMDWLINPNGKVANKAYAMRALYIIGQKTEWVHPELKRILEEDFTKHSAAYKSATKEILTKLKQR